MANARKRKNGTWRIRVFSHYEEKEQPDGSIKKIAKYKSFTSNDPSPKGRKELERKAAEFAYNRERYLATDDNMLFDVALNTYISERSAILSPATIRKYRRQQDNLLAVFKGKPLYMIDRNLVQKYVNELTKTKSAKTVRDAYGLINAVIMRFCPERTIRVTLPKLMPNDSYIPSENDIKKVVVTVIGTEMELPVLLGAFGGMRRGEIAALRTDDINGCIAHVHQTMVLGENNTWIIKAPKSFAGDRYVALPQFLIKKVDFSKEFVVDMKPNQISSAFEHVLNQAGVRHFRFHNLRHYNASIQHALGIPDAYIMQNNGWGNDRTLKSIYRHALAENKETNDNIVMKYFENLYDQKYDHK